MSAPHHYKSNLRDVPARLSAALAVAVVSSLVPGVVLTQTIQEQATRPPPLPPEVGCALWRGVVGGNDPSVQVELRLCPDGDRVRGVLQWSSTLSGWSRRSVEGGWDAIHTHLTVRDLAILEQRPQPGWRFCAVDHYDLVESAPGTLAGTYDSIACAEHATVNLQLVSTNGPRPADVPAKTTTRPVRSPPGPPPSPHAGCAARCGVAAPVREGGRAAVAFLVVVIVLTRSTSARLCRLLLRLPDLRSM